MLYLPFAQAQKKNKKTAASVTYIKKEDNQVYFTVTITNPLRNKFAIAIQDEEGRSLFKSTFNYKKLSRLFTTTLSKGRITVLVTDTEKLNVVGYYEICAENQTAEEMLVTKL